MPMMKELDGLLQGDRNQQTNDDGRDMNEEGFPGLHGFMGRVYIEHLSPTVACWGAF
jgi:hypothetical protein